jgi:outer membrane protein assembly factor BamB
MESEEVVALSLADGSRRWATRIGTVGKNEGPQYPGSRSTPTIDGDSLYALGSDGDLACLDAKSGTVKWSKNLRTEFGGTPGKWAYTESPLIDGDVLLCSPGGSEATVVALNKSDGSAIWKSPIPEADDASFSSPVKATIDGIDQYVLFLSKGVVGLESKTGRVLWRYTNASDKDANVQTPVVSAPYVYTAASRVGGGLVRVSASDTEPEEVYFGRTLPSGMGGNILIDGNLYGASGPTMICVDYATGEAKWQDRSIGTSSLCFADGKLFLHSEDNQVAMIEATPEGYKELGRFTPPNAPERANGKAWTYPIIVDGKLIIRDVGTVWCYDIRG